MRRMNPPERFVTRLDCPVAKEYSKTSALSIQFHRQLVVGVEKTGAIRKPGQAEHGSADLCGVDVDELLLGGTVKIAQEDPGAAVGPVSAVFPAFIQELVGAGGGGSPGEKIAADRQERKPVRGDAQITVV
jgi:hypothetical protein